MTWRSSSWHRAAAHRCEKEQRIRYSEAVHCAQYSSRTAAGNFQHCSHWTCYDASDGAMLSPQANRSSLESAPTKEEAVPRPRRRMPSCHFAQRSDQSPRGWTNCQSRSCRDRLCEWILSVWQRSAVWTECCCRARRRCRGLRPWSYSGVGAVATIDWTETDGRWSDNVRGMYRSRELIAIACSQWRLADDIEWEEAALIGGGGRQPRCHWLRGRAGVP